MNDKQMSSEIKWHRLDDMDDSTYPKKIGELYLIRIYTRDSGHHYGIGRLWDAQEYQRSHHEMFSLNSKSKYLFVEDATEKIFHRKSEGSDYIDGWNDLLFASISHGSSRSQSSTDSKVWLDLRHKK